MNVQVGETRHAHFFLATKKMYLIMIAYGYEDCKLLSQSQPFDSEKPFLSNRELCPCGRGWFAQPSRAFGIRRALPVRAGLVFEPLPHN
jgi:hypothetical protein